MMINSSRCICWLNEVELLVYRKASFFVYNCLKKNLTLFCKMPMKKKHKFVAKFKSLQRLFRAYPQSPALNHVTNELFFSFMGSIYSINISKKIITKEVELKHNATRVLSLCVCENGDVLFGEYPTKYDKEPISIYKKEMNRPWDIVYSFPTTTIRHIHRLMVDGDNLYCFTGDEDSETKIVKFEKMNFKSPIVLASNSQKYRTCLAFHESSNEIVYFTDTPYFQNKVCLFNESSCQSNELFKLEGSVIYGLMDKNDIFFSTVVEKNLKKGGNNVNFPIKINGRDGGIKSIYSTIYLYKNKNELIPVFSLKKDCLSFRFFGLGTFVFTANGNNNYLAFTSSGLKKDGTTFIIEKAQFQK